MLRQKNSILYVLIFVLTSSLNAAVNFRGYSPSSADNRHLFQPAALGALNQLARLTQLSAQKGFNNDSIYPMLAPAWTYLEKAKVLSEEERKADPVIHELRIAVGDILSSKLSGNPNLIAALNEEVICQYLEKPVRAEIADRYERTVGAKLRDSLSAAILTAVEGWHDEHAIRLGLDRYHDHGKSNGHSTHPESGQPIFVHSRNEMPSSRFRVIIVPQEKGILPRIKKLQMRLTTQGKIELQRQEIDRRIKQDIKYFWADDQPALLAGNFSWMKPAGAKPLGGNELGISRRNSEVIEQIFSLPPVSKKFDTYEPATLVLRTHPGYRFEKIIYDRRGRVVLRAEFVPDTDEVSETENAPTRFKLKSFYSTISKFNVKGYVKLDPVFMQDEQGNIVQSYQPEGQSDYFEIIYDIGGHIKFIYHRDGHDYPALTVKSKILRVIQTGEIPFEARNDPNNPWFEQQNLSPVELKLREHVLKLIGNNARLHAIHEGPLGHAFVVFETPEDRAYWWNLPFLSEAGPINAELDPLHFNAQSQEATTTPIRIHAITVEENYVREILENAHFNVIGIEKFSDIYTVVLTSKEDFDRWQIRQRQLSPPGPPGVFVRTVYPGMWKDRLGISNREIELGNQYELSVMGKNIIFEHVRYHYRSQSFELLLPTTENRRTIGSLNPKNLPDKDILNVMILPLLKHQGQLKFDR